MTTAPPTLASLALLCCNSAGPASAHCEAQHPPEGPAGPRGANRRGSLGISSPTLYLPGEKAEAEQGMDLLILPGQQQVGSWGIPCPSQEAPPPPLPLLLSKDRSVNSARPPGTGLSISRQSPVLLPPKPELPALSSPPLHRLRFQGWKYLQGSHFSRQK